MRQRESERSAASSEITVLKEEIQANKAEQVRTPRHNSSMVIFVQLAQMHVMHRLRCLRSASYVAANG